MKSPRIRLSPAFYLLALGASCIAAAQIQAATSSEAANPSTATTGSSILNPAISTLQQALDGIRLDRWKTSNTVRDETDANIASVRRDLETTLPPLIATADADANSVAQVLPAFRNIEALYDVLLRIAAVGRLAAPPQQSAALEQAMSSLESSRRDLGDQLQSAALHQDSRIHDLQASLRTLPPPAPVPAPCPSTTSPAKKRKPHAKPRLNPATPSSTPSQSVTPPTH